MSQEKEELGTEGREAMTADEIEKHIATLVQCEMLPREPSLSSDDKRNVENANANKKQSIEPSEVNVGDKIVVRPKRGDSTSGKVYEVTEKIDNLRDKHGKAINTGYIKARDVEGNEEQFNNADDDFDFYPYTSPTQDQANEEATEARRKREEIDRTKANFDENPTNAGYSREKMEDYEEAIKCYRRTIESALPQSQAKARAQNNLGRMYANGWGVERDFLRAYMWFHLAATQGLDEGKSNCEKMEKIMDAEQIAEAKRIAEKCREQDYKGCSKERYRIKWAKKLSELIFPAFFVLIVIFMIGGVYLLGKGMMISRDYLEAYWENHWENHRLEKEDYRFRKAVETYQSGDYATALAEFTSLIEGRHIESQFYLGVMYDNGWGVPQDDTEAVKWYRRVAEARHSEVGHAETQFNLGLMYEEGRNVPQNDIFAYVWYYLAADKGHEKASKRLDVMANRMTPAEFVEAQYNLGELYANGKGVPRDDAEALKWHRRAAEAGDVNLQYELGWMYEWRTWIYESDDGAPQDDAEALKWYRLAAESGHFLALIKMRKMYESGDIVPQDDAEVLKWHRRAAEMGDTESQYDLGRKYENGEGVPQDYRLAYMWYNIAATRGHEQAEHSRNNVARSMSSEEVAEAKRMSWQCLAQNYKDC